jgi:ATP-dependent helicase/nuclease subunit B
MPPIEIHGNEMDALLRGFVDRVDVWHSENGDFVRVVDYKTGTKDFDYCDVFNGLGLQMLLYLFALEQEGEDLLGANPIPAGVQYFPARIPLLSVDGQMTEEEAAAARAKNWKRKGLLLWDDAALAAMESDDAAYRMPYTRKKDGTISGDIADRDRFNILKSYIFDLLRKLVDGIATGCIEPNPYTRGSSHDACAFCPYGTVCHKFTVENRRNYKAMSAQKFWEEVGKEVAADG